MFEENAQLHIKGINIDWDKISRGSYRRDISSIAEVNSLMFKVPRLTGIFTEERDSLYLAE